MTSVEVQRLVEQVDEVSHEDVYFQPFPGTAATRVLLCC